MSNNVNATGRSMSSTPCSRRWRCSKSTRTIPASYSRSTKKAAAWPAFRESFRGSGLHADQGRIAQHEDRSHQESRPAAVDSHAMWFCRAETDKHQVPQILVNLFSNARNAMIEYEGAAEPGGTLTASSEGPGHRTTFTLQLPIGKETSCLV
jgi:hypothetical protein